MYYTNTPLRKLFLTNRTRHSVPNTSVCPHPRDVHDRSACVPVRLAQRVKLGVQAYTLAVTAFPMRAKQLDDRRRLAAVLADSDYVAASYKYSYKSVRAEPGQSPRGLNCERQPTIEVTSVKVPRELFATPVEDSPNSNTFP